MTQHWHLIHMCTGIHAWPHSSTRSPHHIDQIFSASVIAAFGARSQSPQLSLSGR